MAANRALNCAELNLLPLHSSHCGSEIFAPARGTTAPTGTATAAPSLVLLLLLMMKLTYLFTGRDSLSPPAFISTFSESPFHEATCLPMSDPLFALWLLSG